MSVLGFLLWILLHGGLLFLLHQKILYGQVSFYRPKGTALGQLYQISFFYILLCSLLYLGLLAFMVTLPAFMFFCILFFASLLKLLLCFTVDKILPQKKYLYEVLEEQSFIFLLSFVCLHLTKDPLKPLMPALGILQNPFSYMAILLSLSLYTRQWLRGQNPVQQGFIKPFEWYLEGFVFFAYRLLRWLELLLYHTLLCTVFLGGSLYGLWTLSASLILSAVITLGLGFLMPIYIQKNLFRFNLLYLLPFLLLVELIKGWI